jgi:hypothetical protein
VVILRIIVAAAVLMFEFTKEWTSSLSTLNRLSEVPMLHKRLSCQAFKEKEVFRLMVIVALDHQGAHSLLHLARELAKAGSGLTHRALLRPSQKTPGQTFTTLKRPLPDRRTLFLIRKHPIDLLPDPHLRIRDGTVSQILSAAVYTQTIPDYPRASMASNNIPP